MYKLTFAKNKKIGVLRLLLEEIIFIWGFRKESIGSFSPNYVDHRHFMYVKLNYKKKLKLYIDYDELRERVEEEKQFRIIIE